MKKVLVLFGGESTEHDVSIMSARNVYGAIDTAKFDVDLCYVDHGGRFYLVDGFWTTGSSPTMTPQQEIVPVLGAGEFRLLNGDETIKPDVILPILHGHGGEDGAIQGLAELLHIPMVGCGLESSAVCMNKEITKDLLESFGIRTVPYVCVRKYGKYPKYEKLTKLLGKTLFIKPARQGSSVGISKVENEEKLKKALNEAFKFDDLVLIEKAIVGRELEVAVLGNAPDVLASGVGEIRAADFYDYDAKYADSSDAEVLVSAELPDNIKDKIQKLATQAFLSLNCRGLARVDFFLDEDGEVLVNEVNTLPGFTNISMYPKLWQAAGIDNTDLITKLINLGLEE